MCDGRDGVFGWRVVLERPSLPTRTVTDNVLRGEGSFFGCRWSCLLIRSVRKRVPLAHAHPSESAKPACGLQFCWQS